MAFNKTLSWFRKTSQPEHSGPVLTLLQNNGSLTVGPPMRFNDVNESGNVNRTDKGASLFRFHYINDFYGSCTFKARVVAQRHLPLRLEDDSVALETYEVKKGTLPLLLRISKTFFRRMLGKYSSVGQLGR